MQSSPLTWHFCPLNSQYFPQRPVFKPAIYISPVFTYLKLLRYRFYKYYFCFLGKVVVYCVYDGWKLYFSVQHITAPPAGSVLTSWISIIRLQLRRTPSSSLFILWVCKLFRNHALRSYSYTCIVTVNRIIPHTCLLGVSVF